MAEEEIRKIIHLDMDAFYASVEQRDNPELRGRPVAVGGSRRRGVVAAASYEARRYGVHSAMPSVVALRKCPELVFVKPRFDVYKDISRQMRAIFAEYTPLIEPLALDEAYLDVTRNLKNIASATWIAREIQAEIYRQTSLTASAGVSYNKFLAKLASEYNKPNGFYVITPEQGAAFVEPLPVGKFHGIGPVTAEKMNRLGIFTGGDLRQQTEAFLLRQFGKAGRYYYAISRALDDRPVVANRLRKSIGSETTYPQDLTTAAELVAGLEPLLQMVWDYGAGAGLSGRTVTVKIRFADFHQITRSHSTATPLTAEAELRRIGQELIASILPLTQGVRLLGITLSNLQPAPAATTTEAAAQQMILDL